jgi:16S rRNA (cytidine1402-2'-O)-methyltransferase
VVSGLPSHEFLFVGFLPQKKGRQTKLKELSQEKRTIILYESPHKIISTLEQIVEFFGEERKVSLSREISKMYEETLRGKITEVLERCKEKPLKGEIVLLIDGK